MSEFDIRQIDESYNTAMLEILRRSPMEAGGLTLCVDKQPDIFAQSRIKYRESKHLGLFDNGTLKGFGSIAIHDCLIDGRMQQAFYYYNFFVLPEARGSRFAERAGRWFYQHGLDPEMTGYAVTLKGNRPAEKYMRDASAKQLVEMTVIDSFVIKNIILAFPHKHRSAYQTRRAMQDDVPNIVKLLQDDYHQRLFAPEVTESNFLSLLQKRTGLQLHDYFVATNAAGKIVGVCAAWDCSMLRQTRVLRYSKKFWPDLVGYRMLSAFAPLVPLPRVGEHFREVTLIDFATVNRDAGIMHALLSTIYNEYRGKNYHYITFGSCGTDPLLRAADTFWHKSNAAHLVLLTPPGKPLDKSAIRLPYVEVAML